ncbi:hypothetical protein KQH90_12230 [Anaerosalibacter bizertensis]|uniref:hypothetical protein n=1 Tax=Anaerosalibacter bizertensis TaxID=932217 RepID=UPI001C0EA9C5|nr:hypothetical protein [Anaerosalibacter bizertensis]MBU5294773.1 hypothetical protein [Anaerosalibacter bizertensis]
MLSIDRILEISKDMGVTIKADEDGKHYIIDDFNNKIEFNTDMLLVNEHKMNFQEIELEFSEMIKINTSSTLYNPSKCCYHSYSLGPIEIDEGNVIAA